MNGHELVNGEPTAVHHTTEYSSVIKRSKLLTHAVSWMNLKNIMLGERSQTQETTRCDSVFMKCPEEANF